MEIGPENQSGSLPLVICGQGLAGTLLAWQLLGLGQKVLVYDPGEAVTSSRVAAGIITPVTGQRLTLTPGLGQFLPEARAGYARIARHLGITHFHACRQIRLWQHDAEPARFASRCQDPEFAAQVHGSGEAAPLVDPALFQGSGQGFVMENSGWLDTAGWLDASAAWFADRGLLRREKLPPEAVRPEAADRVLLPDGQRAAAVIFCEGAAARHNPWFPWLRWKCAKGEILTFSAPALAFTDRILNFGGWLLPGQTAGTFRTGSTYVWDELDQTPTAAARETLEARLRQWVRPAWQVTAHQAAVRPILHQSLARMGRHPVHPALVFFNGLGSKGVLHGPRYARMLAENLVHGTPLPGSLDIAGN